MLTFRPSTSASGIAEQVLGTSIEGFDTPLCVNHDDAVEGHGEDRVETLCPRHRGCDSRLQRMLRQALAGGDPDAPEVLAVLRKAGLLA